MGKSMIPPLLLAKRWDGMLDPKGWWLSEKLDGVRAYWDGQNFISRLGNTYFAPDWFVENLPDHPLDGELWGGRKQFQNTVSIVRKRDRSDNWAKIIYVVFDVPNVGGPFEDRLKTARVYLKGQPYAKFHTQRRCKGVDHLKEELNRIEQLGGEGLMLRRPKSEYEIGRSSTLLKVKSFHDAEALIIDHLEGAGRHKGRLGALLVELPDGTRFAVGTGLSDAERNNPPPIGGVITYRFQELSEGGVPRFPIYVGERCDVKWSKGRK